MAGQAPITRETRIPSSNPSVSSAAPRAVQPNTLSTTAPVRTRPAGGGELISCLRSASLRYSREASWAGSVEDKGSLAVMEKAGARLAPRQLAFRPASLLVG